MGTLQHAYPTVEHASDVSVGVEPTPVLVIFRKVKEYSARSADHLYTSHLHTIACNMLRYCTSLRERVAGQL